MSLEAETSLKTPYKFPRISKDSLKNCTTKHVIIANLQIFQLTEWFLLML